MSMISRPNKYHAKPTIYNGIRYDSKSEAVRAWELDALVRADEISWWTRQVPFWLGNPKQKMVVDFVCAELRETVAGNFYRLWAEEVKGFDTPIWRRNKKLWIACGPIPLRVFKRRGNTWAIETLCSLKKVQR